MAIPPDPISEIIRDATSVVVCEVFGASPNPPHRETSNTAVSGDVENDDDDEDDDSDEQLPSQSVLLIVRTVLHGKLAIGERVHAEKPIGEYALKAGYVGPFLLDERHKPALILGRYGPDSYRVDEIRRALRARR